MALLQDIKFDDPNVWKLLQSGHTCGIFQCESELVQNWLRRIKPINIWELSAVIAIVRPGALKSGFADEYVSYRNGTKEKESFGHPIIDDVFNTTDGILLYQESLIQLGLRLAWSHLEENEKLKKADELRKAVGKKDQKKLLQIGQDFVDSSILNGVDTNVADKLFEIIKNCGRYLFNLSHSISYARYAYRTAYLKTYYPLEFYTTYLSFAKYKPKKWEEISRLIYESRIFDINIVSPNINIKNHHFMINRDTNQIIYGLSHIKHVGETDVNKLQSIPIIDNWQKFLILSCTNQYEYKPRSNTTIALICSGAFKDTNIPRRDLLQLFDFVKRMTDRELNFIVDNLEKCITLDDFTKLVNECINKICNKSRKNILESRLSFLKFNTYDHPVWIENQEKNYLGVGITSTAVDAKDNANYDKCIDCYHDETLWAEKHLAVVIDSIYYHTIKTGKNAGKEMGKCTVHDSSSMLKYLPIFSDDLDIYRDLLVENNIVYITVKRGNGGWFINRVQQL